MQTARNTTLQSVASLEISGQNATKYTGGLVGRMVKSTINGCKVDGTIEVSNPSNLLGGVVGLMEDSSISDCGSKLVFSPTSPAVNHVIVGGIIGGAKSSQCNHSYAQFNLAQTDIEAMPFIAGIAGRFLNSSMSYVLFSGLYGSDQGAELFYPISQLLTNSTFEKTYFYSDGQQNAGEYRPLSTFKDGTLLQADFEGSLNWQQGKDQLPKLTIESLLEPEIEDDPTKSRLPD